MQRTKAEDWFILLYKHFNLISIFEKNKKYSYKPYRMVKGKDSYYLEFDIINELETKEEKDDRANFNTGDNTIFNQEPRILKMGQFETR